MYTVTLSYDKNNALAQQQLAALLATGLFEAVKDVEEEFPGLEYSDPWLYEDHGDMPQLPKDKDTFTPEEALEIILDDIRKMYKEDDAA